MPFERVLLGPGPSVLPPAVVAAMSRPQSGHMDPDLVPLLDETVGLLRRVFQTRNELTLPVSGSGTAGMEATLRHLLADEALLVVCTAGYFGDRIATIGQQVGAQVARVEAPWGRPVDPADLERVLRAAPAAERVVVAAVHVETSTGVLQAVPDLAPVAHARGHHTVPVPLVYALHAALRLVVEEGLEARVERHHRHARMLWRGLKALGLELFVPEADRASTLITLRVPAGVDDEHSSQVRHVVLWLGALARVLAADGLRVPAAAEVARAALQAER